MTLVGVDHVQLAAPPGSEVALRAFYVDVLGMTETPKPPGLAGRGGCWFQSGAVRLHLGVDRDFRPARKAHPGLLVRDIAALANRLAGHGIDVDWDDLLPGRRRFYCTDPVGNRLEFLPLSPAGD
ncbi:VOC family protein [Streptomyces sp. NPDC002790]|uniref:VOC family protein n=1 Tax=Streptomyces sp. NPDC002790 TaxID=3154431 RepID=UPI003321CC09